MRFHTALLLSCSILALCHGTDLTYDDEDLSLEVAAVNSTACSTGYIPAGRGCACKAGFGSHVPGWKTEQYPVTPPACRLFAPATDSLYNSSITFPPAGQGTGRCFCFPCPANYTSTGGALNSSSSACALRLPSVLLAVNYTLGASGSSNSSRCGPSLTNAAMSRLRAALKQQANVTARAATGCGPMPGASSASGSSLQLSVRLTYAGSNAQQVLPRFVAVARSINTNRCAFGVCSGLRNVSKGAVSVTAAAAATRTTGIPASPPGPPPACSPTKCDDKVCQTGSCSAGKCSYTPVADSTNCTDGPVKGKCQAGFCVGMTANIDAAAQGQTEPVIFKARFASTAGLNGTTQVVLHGRKGNTTDGIGDVLGTLFDDGLRVHDDRYANDGLFSNVIFVDFPKTNEAVYRNFYVSLLDRDVSSQVIITAITTDFDVFIQIFPTADLVSTAQEQLDEIQAAGATPEAATQQMYDLLIRLTGSGSQRRRLSDAATAAASAAVAPGAVTFNNFTSIIPKIKNGTVRKLTERRIEFLTQEDFPCLILATDDYGKPCSSSRSIGDDSAAGETPIIMSGASLDFLNTDYNLDWQAGRMVLTADGRFALRPSWFEKYRDDPKVAPGRTIVLFSSDRSAVNSGSDAAQQQRGFPQAFWGMTGSLSYAGYTSYISRSFPAGASPGVAMARHLLANGTAGNYTGTGAVDQRTGAVFKSYAFRPTATLTDRCAAICGDVRCNPEASEVCNPLTGTCDIKCDGKEDGTACKLRGFESKCAAGVCTDLCKSALCSATACRELLVPEGSLCPPATGVCNSKNKTDGTDCEYSASTPGACSGGLCARLYIIYYRVEGPVASFPSPLSSTAALTSFGSSVGSSLSLPAGYPASNVQTTVLKTLSRRSTPSSNSSSGAAVLAEASASSNRTIRAVTPKVTETQAVLFKSSFPESSLLSLEMEFSILASPARMLLVTPYGPGLSVQRADSNGNILNAVDYCVIRQTPCVAANACQNATCVPRTGECTITNLPDGTACSGNTIVNGTCRAAICAAQATVCSNNPCGSIEFAVNGSCSVARRAAGTKQQGFTCTCQPRYTWLNGACIANTCFNKPCNIIANTVQDACSDAPGSFTGFACKCTVGLAWSDRLSGCTDPACASNPCGQVAFAVDRSCQPSPFAPGYSCGCVTGYVWNRDAVKCVDFCAAYNSTECRQANCNATAATISFSNINEGGSCTIPANRRRQAGSPGICRSGNCTAPPALPSPPPSTPPSPSPSPSPSPAAPTCNVDDCKATVPATTCYDYGGLCPANGSLVCEFNNIPTDSSCSLPGGDNGLCSTNQCRAASRFYRGEMDNFPATPVYPIALVSRKAAAFASDPGTVYYTALDNTVRKTVPVIDPTSASPYAVASDIVYDFSGTSGPGSLRGIALDEVTNSLYVTDYDQNCVHRILLPNNINSPAISVPAMGACGPSACGGPGSYGCTDDTFTDASQATLWGPTDIEIVYTDTSNYLTLQAYITDSGNGCVRKFTRNNFWLTTYEPMVFGACGANRNLSTVIPTYLAADATNIAANSVPALYVAFTEMNQIRWHDPSAAMYTATFDAKDKAGSACRVSDMAYVPNTLLVACDDINAAYGGVFGSFGLLSFPAQCSSNCNVTSVLPLNMGGGNGTMLDPYITRTAGIALFNGSTDKILISDGGRLGIKQGDVSSAAAIKPGFTAVVSFPSPPVLNLRVKQLAAGYRYTCGQELDSELLRCWGQRPDFVTAAPPVGTILGAFAVGKYHYCYQVAQIPGPSGTTVVCTSEFGNISFGQVDPPLALLDGTDVAIQMCAGEVFTCAITVGEPSDVAIQMCAITVGEPSDVAIQMCAITVGQRLRCWGNWGNTANWQDGFIPSNGSVFTTDYTVKAIGCGRNHMCAVVGNALPYEIVCTAGAMPAQPCGEKCNVPAGWEAPQVGFDFKVTAGVDHTCALSGDGGVLCWGDNTYYQLDAPAITKVSDIAAGDYFTCGINKDAQVFCWGKDTGAGQQMAVPASLAVGAPGGGGGATHVTAGNDHVCVRKENGQMTCWGYCATGACNIPRPPSPGTP
ncbi:hypothetical protein OEZ86_010366 [Tetradesmus obliquus]|nr:hypothetical protein OEZ86_010366 [Tetradesmus obliquus]